ncbi:MAG: GspH/FimT family pseudopilin [Gammaproteobacteria bacterium]
MLKKNIGYTLLELLITLGIISILLLVAIPGWQALLEKNRATVVVNQLREAIYYARSEALKRGVTVSVCKTVDQITCSGTWAEGQLVFLDINRSGIIQSPNDILRVFDPLPAGSILTWKGALGQEDYVQVKPSYVTPGTFYFCPGAREIKVSVTGRVRVEKGQCN